MHKATPGNLQFPSPKDVEYHCFDPIECKCGSIRLSCFYLKEDYLKTNYKEKMGLGDLIEPKDIHPAVFKALSLTWEEEAQNLLQQFQQQNGLAPLTDSVSYSASVVQEEKTPCSTDPSLVLHDSNKVEGEEKKGETEEGGDKININGKIDTAITPSQSLHSLPSCENVSVEHIGADHVKLRWDKSVSEFAKHSPCTFEIQVQYPIVPSLAVKSHAVDTCSVTVSGLAPATPYCFQIRCKGSGNPHSVVSEWSHPICVTTGNLLLLFIYKEPISVHTSTQLLIGEMEALQEENTQLRLMLETQQTLIDDQKSQLLHNREEINRLQSLCDTLRADAADQLQRNSVTPPPS
ncbi:hypothetical protein RFI_15202 [Reticulomyxa filosa]|uniref:Fibronectin type-III domain-containing protein n=1 Tax=Reticulomyxa filosa TaxID=46433 RepID=X6N6V5_RETFI|nr:hypothetical protein RFI_15202 [Reticulomyxa filosa]|eukprot:ETO22000.1 hypothetical protein RFI_15202 [Reticulomyxa filosa]